MGDTDNNNKTIDFEDFLYGKIIANNTPREFFDNLKTEIVKINLKVPRTLAIYLSELIPIAAKPNHMEKALDAFVSAVFIKGFRDDLLNWQKKHAQEFYEKIHEQHPKLGAKNFENLMATAERLRKERGI